MTYSDKLKRIIGDTPLTPAEQRLIDENGVVGFAKTRPSAPTADNTIRPELIRHLAEADCPDITLSHSGLVIVGAWVNGPLNLNGLRNDISITLVHSHIAGQIDFNDAQLYKVILSGSFCNGLHGQRCKLTSNLFLNKGFHATGTVDLHGAMIGGQLSCSRGRFDGNAGKALTANRLTVKGSLFLRDGFHATGTVDLRGATVDGQLDCRGGRFDGNGGSALTAQGLIVTGDLFLNNKFHATGTVDLLGATVGGQLACSGGRFDGNDGTALTAQGLIVTGDLFLRSGFRATGAVNLTGAKIGGQLACEGGSFSGDLRCQEMQVNAGWFYRRLKYPPKWLNATNMSVGTLDDDADAWERTKKLDLEGFTFNGIISDISPAQRLAIWNRKLERAIKPKISDIPWLRRAPQQDFDPAPHSFLARYYDRSGQHSAARDIRVSRDWRTSLAQYHTHRLGLDGSALAGWRELTARPVLALRWIYWLTLGYGHKPARSLAALLCLGLIGWLVFSLAHTHHQMVPAQAPILASADWQRSIEQAPDNPVAHWKAHSDIGKDYETFNAVLYTADVIIPLIDFTQEAAWSPSPTRGDWGRRAFWAKPVLKFLGWLLTAIAAAVTGVIGRKD